VAKLVAVGLRRIAENCTKSGWLIWAPDLNFISSSRVELSDFRISHCANSKRRLCFSLGLPKTAWKGAKWAKLSTSSQLEGSQLAPIGHRSEIGPFGWGKKSPPGRANNPISFKLTGSPARRLLPAAVRLLFSHCSAALSLRPDEKASGGAKEANSLPLAAAN